MSRDDATTDTLLSDDDIRTVRRSGRRRFLGLAALGGAAAAGLGNQAMAQARDGDSGNWTDQAGCERGQGGTFTGRTDADNGAISDISGQGRGAPRC